MHAPQRLRLEPRPSRIACVLLASACTATAALLASLPLEWPIGVAAGAVVVTAAARGFWRCTGRGVPALVHVGGDRRLTVTGRDGRSRDGTICDDSYVGALITVVTWRPDDAWWLEPAQSILILPDTLPPDDFRQLRVLLRYGRPVTAGRTSGVDAS